MAKLFPDDIIIACVVYHSTFIHVEYVYKALWVQLVLGKALYAIRIFQRLIQLNIGNEQFINTLTGLQTAGVGHDLELCTKEISDFRHSLPELAYGDLVFVDTPGFDGMHKSDADILKMVADWLKTTFVYVVMDNL